MSQQTPYNVWRSCSRIFTRVINNTALKVCPFLHKIPKKNKNVPPSPLCLSFVPFFKYILHTHYIIAGFYEFWFNFQELRLWFPRSEKALKNLLVTGKIYWHNWHSEGVKLDHTPLIFLYACQFNAQMPQASHHSRHAHTWYMSYLSSRTSCVFEKLKTGKFSFYGPRSTRINKSGEVNLEILLQ